MPPLSTLTARATHALSLHPAALASVPYGIALVRVRDRVRVLESRSGCFYLTELVGYGQRFDLIST